MKPKLKTVGWFFFGLITLVLFTLFKLPREPMKASIRDFLSGVLEEQAVSFTSAEEDLSFLLKPTYEMRKVTLTLPPPSPPAQLDRVSLSPLFLPLFLGRVGAQIEAQAGQGKITLSGASRKSFLSASFQAKHFDLARLGILPLVAGIQGSALIDGEGSFSSDLQAMNQADGSLQLTLSQIQLDPQTVAGFSLPRLKISEATFQLLIQEGKVKFTQVRMGKTTQGAAADDLRAQVTGEISLGKTLDFSNLNLKVNFSFSENVMKSFALVDALLGAGKQADGSYTFSLTGPIMNPNALPIGSSGGP